MSNNNNEMKKELGMGAAMATVVGCVIGSGVFFKPTAIYTATGGAPGLAIIAWVVTSLVCLVCGNDICRNRNLDSRNRRYARISEKGIR